MDHHAARWPVEMTPMLVGVMGPSGAGKSTLAKTLARRRPRMVARVPVDHFFVPRPDSEGMSDFLARPLDYDWEAIDRLLADDCAANRSSPRCDFTTFERRAPVGGLAIPVRPVYVLDGMRPHPRLDALVVLELDATTQGSRLRARDERWNTDVHANLSHLRLTHQRGRDEVDRQDRRPDLVLDATAPVEVNAGQVEKVIDSVLAARRVTS